MGPRSIVCLTMLDQVCPIQILYTCLMQLPIISPRVFSRTSSVQYCQRILQNGEDLHEELLVEVYYLDGGTKINAQYPTAVESNGAVTAATEK